MALIETWVCIKCEKTRNSVRPRDDICYKCAKKKADKKKAAHFAELDELTFNERLRKVEKWQYEHSHDELQERMYLDG